VAQVEGDGGQAQWLGVNFGIGEACGPESQIVEGQIECVQDGAACRRDLGVGSAQPRFDGGSGYR
jgi:hypothetical protein